jgi:hypothetical protein
MPATTHAPPTSQKKSPMLNTPPIGGPTPNRSDSQRNMSSDVASRCFAPPSVASLWASAANEDDPDADRTAAAVTGIPPFAAITIPFSTRPTATTAMPGRRMFATTKISRKT